MATLQDLVNDVAAETTEIGMLTAFINNLKAQITAIPGITPAQQTEIDSIFAGMEANKAAISAAMAPTVVTPPPVVPPAAPAATHA